MRLLTACRACVTVGLLLLLPDGTRETRGHAAGAIATGTASPSASPSPSPAPTPDTRRLHAVLINGGSRADENFRSHVLHLREMSALLLKAGLARERITIFASDGASPGLDLTARTEDPPGFWLLTGTGLERELGEPLQLENSSVPGFTLEPANRAAIGRWFQGADRRLADGDTLLIYVTDHGKDDPRDPRQNRITLWGPRENLTVRQLAGELERLPDGVRVVTIMSQCFSGGFAQLLHVGAKGGVPSGAVCGYFASTADRPAYGCYPEASRDDRRGHSFAMIDALTATGSLAKAHTDVLTRDHTPDVPLRTSDAYLTELLDGAARGAGIDRPTLVDRWLPQAIDRRVEEVAVAGRVAQAYGFVPPKSLAELRPVKSELPQLSRLLESFRGLWRTGVSDATRANYQRLIAAHPEWARRLNRGAVRRLSTEERRKLVRQLITALETQLDENPRHRERLEALAEKMDAVAGAAERMEVRQAALLRVEHLLTSAAGRMQLGAAAGTRKQRDALAALESCEALALGTPGGPDNRPAVDPFPPWDQDRSLVPTLRPSWLGIAFDPVAPNLRARLRLSDGAALVTAVQPGSPAQRAGLLPGDIIAGAVGQPFTEASQIRTWALLSPRDKELELESIRRGARRVVRVTLAPYPDR
jgi:hypothetical protein